MPILYQSVCHYAKSVNLKNIFIFFRYFKAIYFYFLLIFLCAIPSKAVPSFDSTIAQLSNLASSDSIYKHIKRLQDFGTRYALSDSCRAAERYVYDYFTSLKLDSVSYDTVFYQGIAMRNVIGTIRGILDPEALVILCAHIDAMSSTPLICAPGAEDNASGVSVVMEAARILKNTKPEYSIKFIAFTGEDIGLVGSEHLANVLSSSCTRISTLLNLDMIAWPGGTFGVKILCDTATQYLAAIENAAVQLYTTLDPQIIVRKPLPSDNYPFQIRGYPCLANIERMVHDTDGYKWYHTCYDTIGNLSMPLAAEITKAATATLMILMNVPAPPAGLVPSISTDNKTITVRWVPNMEKDIAGYTLYWGTTTRKYTDSVKINSLADTFSIVSTVNDTLLYFSLKAFDSTGNSSWFSCEKSCRQNSGVSRFFRQTMEQSLFRLRHFSNGIEIEYRLDKPRFVSLSVYDLKGRIIKTIVNELQPSGIHRIKWDRCDASGNLCHQRVLTIRYNGFAAKAINIH